MGAEAEEETKKITKLPFLSIRPVIQSPERSGIASSPLHTAASVPFLWEEEPGKPKTPCKELSMPSSDSSQKCLELPPRMFMDAKTTKLSSPRTVLEGPYIGRPKFQSSSFRMTRDCYRGGSNWSPESINPRALVLSKRWQLHKQNEKGWFSSWSKKKLSFKGKREFNGDSYALPSLMDRGDEGSRVDDQKETSQRTSGRLARVSRSGKFPVLTRAKSHIMNTLCKNFRQVVPWKRRKVKKDDMVA